MATSAKLQPGAFDALMAQLAEPKWPDGIPLLDIPSLPDSVQEPVRKMVKRAMTLEELADELGLSVEQAGQIAGILLANGVLERVDGPDEGTARYRVHAASVRPRRIPPGL